MVNKDSEPTLVNLNCTTENAGISKRTTCFESQDLNTDCPCNYCRSLSHLLEVPFLQQP